MISFDAFNAIRAMLAEGVSVEQIQQTIKASTGTIAEIKKGTHVWQKRLAAGQSIEGKSEKGRSTRISIATRCPECGRKVQMPCRICAAEEFKSREREQGRSYEPIDEVRFDGPVPESSPGLAKPEDDQPGCVDHGSRKVQDDWESRARAILGC